EECEVRRDEKEDAPAPRARIREKRAHCFDLANGGRAPRSKEKTTNDEHRAGHAARHVGPSLEKHVSRHRRPRLCFLVRTVVKLAGTVAGSTEWAAISSRGVSGAGGAGGRLARPNAPTPGGSAACRKYAFKANPSSGVK